MRDVCLLLFFTLFQVSHALGSVTLPASTLLNAEGDTIMLRDIDFEDKLMVEFWSPTCALCNVKVNTLAEDHDQWTDSIVWKIVLVVPEMPNKEYAQWATRNSWPFDIYFDPEGELSRALSKIDAKVSLPKSYIIDDAFNMLNVSSKASLLERRIVLDIYEDPEIVALPSMELPSMNKHIVDLSYYYELAKVLN